MAAFLRWYSHADYTSTGETFGVGRSVYAAIRRAMAGTPALRCGPAGIRDNGNGAQMRFAPLALYCTYSALPREEEARMVSEVGGLIHGHAISKLGCLIYGVLSLNRQGYLLVRSSHTPCGVGRVRNRQ